MKKAMIFCAAGALLAGLATSAMADGGKKDTRLQRQQARAAKKALKQQRNEQQQQGPRELQPVPSTMEPTFVLPKRMAKILGFDDKGMAIYGEWVPYTGNQTDNPDLPPIAWDMFEGDWNDPLVCDGDPFQHFMANGPLSGGFGAACDFGAGGTGACGDFDTNRWWYGPEVFASGFLDKIEEFASTFGCPDALVSFVPFAWNQGLGAGDISNCGNYIIGTTIINVLTYGTDMGDLFDGSPYTRVDLDAANLGGVAFDFGFLDPGNGYYWTNADLQGTGFEFPAVEGGLLEVQFINSDDFEENFFPATGMFGMLWGSKETALQGNRSNIIYVDGWTQVCEEYDFEYNTGGGGEALDVTGTVPCPTNFFGMMIGLHADPDCGGGGGVCPDSQTILAGFQSSGGFGDVCDSDDVRSVYQSLTFAAAFSPAPIAVQFDGNFAGAGAALSFNMEAHPTLGSGSAFLTVQLWNYTTSSYNSVPFINQPDGTDTVYTNTVDNSGGDYVDTNGDVRALITAAKTLDGPVRLNVDQVSWSD